jgi:hypothetical protein
MSRLEFYSAVPSERYRRHVRHGQLGRNYFGAETRDAPPFDSRRGFRGRTLYPQHGHLSSRNRKEISREAHKNVISVSDRFFFFFFITRRAPFLLFFVYRDKIVLSSSWWFRRATTVAKRLPLYRVLTCLRDDSFACDDDGRFHDHVSFRSW